MIDVAVVAGALHARLPHLSDARVDYFARAIALAVYEPTEDATTSELDNAAALVVNLERESRGERRVERCIVVGMSGWGAWQVNELWSRRFPGATCGTVDEQARGSLGVWLIGWRHERGDVRRAFGRYIGARAVGWHPEARRRARIWYSVRASLECACSR